jgi:hypothetical protein
LAVLFAVCPGGASAIKSNETYLNSAKHIPAGLFALACEQVASTWSSADHRVPPGPADILAGVRVISRLQRVDRQRRELRRSFDEAMANRLTPERALVELEARRGAELPVDQFERQVEARYRKGLARIAGVV